MISVIVVVISADGKYGLLTQLSRKLISATIQEVGKMLKKFFIFAQIVPHLAIENSYVSP